MALDSERYGLEQETRVLEANFEKRIGSPAFAQFPTF